MSVRCGSHTRDELPDTDDDACALTVALRATVHFTLPELRLTTDASCREPLQGHATRSTVGGSKKIRTTPWTKMSRHDLGI
jgi:hypothetical protein